MITEQTEQADLGYGQLFAILWRRRFWFLSIFSMSLLVAVIITLKRESIYQSSMQLLVEPNYQSKQQPSANGNDFTGSDIQIDYATQLNLMQSSSLLQKALNQLKKADPSLSLTVEELKMNLVVTKLSTKLLKDEIETKIVEVSFTSNNPLQSQKILQALQQVYQQYNYHYMSRALWMKKFQRNFFWRESLD